MKTSFRTKRQNLLLATIDFLRLSPFVSAHKVKSVKNMVRNINYTITVSPIEPIEEAFK